MNHSVSEIMFSLIRFSVCGEDLPKWVPDSLTPQALSELYNLSKRQDIAHILADALLTNKLIPDGEIKNLYLKEQMTSVFRHAQIKHELAKIYRALDEAEIRYMPLKGSVIRNYYPKPELRTSCDIDIFVDKADVDLAASVFIDKLSYRFDVRTQHDIAYFSQSKTHVELHYDLTDEDVKAEEMLSHVWDESFYDAPSNYRALMNNEMFVAYHIAHMAKHFLHGGCGIRPFIDLWIMENKMGYDREKTFSLLDIGGLSEFAKQAILLSRVWLSNAEHTDMTREVEDYILDASIYGNIENRVAISQSKRGNRFKYIIGRIFLPYGKLKKIYPNLEKYPVLLPFYEVKRWFRMIFRKNTSRAISELKATGNINSEKQKRILLMLDRLGLN